MRTLIFAILCISFVHSETVLAAGYKFVKSFTVAVEEPSGLTYDQKTDTLWTVRDGGGGLYQLDKQGKVLKAINIPSDDLEGIAYKASSDTFLLAEERKREILEIDRDGAIIQRINVPIKYRLWNLNYGIEGVSYNPKNGHIFIVNEKHPRAVMELDEDGVIIKSFEVEELGDLSGIYYDSTSGNLILLSHESKVIMEFTPEGEFTSVFSIDVPKAEGITKDGSGNIYIICDKTNTLYVYAPI